MSAGNVRRLRILLGGGTQKSLGRIIGKAQAPGIRFDWVSSQDEPQVWGRKAQCADVVIVRTGWVSHKAWVSAKGMCPEVIPVPLNGEAAMLDAIAKVVQEADAYASRQEAAFVGFVATYVD